MSDLIRRIDAVQACQVGPSDEWSRSTKSGYNQAATDCTMNILHVPAVQPVTVDELAQIIRIVDGNHSLGAGALAERILSAVALLAVQPHVKETPKSEHDAGNVLTPATKEGA